MTEQESKDLELMKSEIKTLKISCFDHCVMLSHLDPVSITHTGHKSVEAGIVWTVRKYMKDIQAKTSAHIRKYPD